MFVFFVYMHLVRVGGQACMRVCVRVRAYSVSKYTSVAQIAEG